MKKILFLVFLILCPNITEAKIYILIDEASSQKFPIAVPQFLTTGGSGNSHTKEITSLIRKDLEIAGIFKVLDESSFLRNDSDVETVDFSKWTAIEAHALIKGIVDNKSGKSLIEMRLYDTQTEKLLVGKQYTVKKNDYAAAVHRFVDEVMQSLTGKAGPFTSKIAASCGSSNRRQIFMTDIDGATQATVTRIKANNISPNWSPNGNTLVFTSFLKYYPEIFSINADGSALRQLTSNQSTNITPAFSPNGDTIVFSSSRSGDTELYTMSNSGKLTGRLTKIINIDVSPAWSPDGSQVVFASERAGNLHLFLTDSGGGATSRLTYTGYQNDQPDWSPDGRRIVFTARDRGAFDIFVMNSDGSTIQRLTRGEGNNESPTWSPDSRYIAFASTRRGASGVYVMLEDGNNQTLIPYTSGCINPDWGPRLR